MAIDTLTRIHADAVQAREAARVLDVAADDVMISIRQGESTREVTVSAEILPTVVAFLDLLAQHGAVDVAPAETVIGTQDAARILNVSRPHLVALLEKGAIPFTKAGTHRRLLLRDVVAYRERQLARSRAAMREMAQLDRELGGL